jgi:hemolysin activation/secretion protein
MRSVRRAFRRVQAGVAATTAVASAFALALGIGWAATAWAADTPLSQEDPSRLAPAPPRPPSAPLIPPAPPPVASAEETRTRFVLIGAVFDGARAVSQRDLNAAWAPYAGKAVNLHDLRAIGRRAEAVYIRRGYPFVAVRLKVQQVQAGVVHFDVIEGRIADLTVLGKDPTARRQATAMLEPLVNKAPLPVDKVDYAYQLVRQVPALSASGTLRPSDEPGGMDLVVETSRHDPFRVYANVNNLYADAVGPWGVLLGADYDGDSDFGDHLSALAYSSISSGRQVLVHGSYERGLDSWGTQVMVSGLWGEANPVAGGAQPLKLATNIAVIRAEVSQPILERYNENAVVDVGLEGNDQKTELSPTLPLSDDNLRDFTASLSGELTGALGRLAGSIELRQGLTILGASRELSRLSGDPQATIIKVSFEAQSATFHALSFAAHSDLQYAAEPLTEPDQYGFGNLTIGRGYQPGLALSDSVVAGSLEARLGPFPLSKTWAALQVQPFAFVDSGRLFDREGPAYSLTSIGGGLRFQLAGKFEMDLVYADPLDGPPGVRRPPSTVLLNMTVGLSDIFTSIHRRIAQETGK